jgi:hypothetical protein
MFSTLSSQLRNKVNKNFISLTLKNLYQINSYSNINNKSLLFRTQKAKFSSVYVNHRDTIDNNQDSPFDFTEENYIKVQEILVIKKINDV